VHTPGNGAWGRVLRLNRIGAICAGSRKADRIHEEPFSAPTARRFATATPGGCMHRDKKLLAGYRKGETWAYEALYHEHAEPVRRFLVGGFTFVSRGRTCRYRGGGYAGGVGSIDVDGVVQETFARAFSESTRRNYDGERPFKNYLFSIAKNLVLREFQRKERVLGVDQTDETTDMLARRGVNFGLTSQSHSPEHQVADDQLHTVTHAFIAELDDEEQTFFSIRFARGLTQEATAREMGVTRARIKLLEKQLRARFLERLRDHGYFVGYTPKSRWSREQTKAVGA
jgi:RNA polymerase sigma factor (sigma-70 family)